MKTLITTLLLIALPWTVSAYDMVLRKGSLHINKNLIYHDSLCLDRFIRKIPRDAWRTDAEVSYLMFDCFSDHPNESPGVSFIGTFHSTICFDDILDSTWTVDTAPSLQLRGLYIEATHDTTKKYIKEIKEVCDTTWMTCAVYGCGCTRPFKISCDTDTIWADKIPVYLTPGEGKWLLDIIKGLDSCFVSIYNQLVDENKKIRR